MLHSSDRNFQVIQACFLYRLCFIALALILLSMSTANAREKNVCRKSDGFPDIIHFYQKYISPVDGDRCPMYPSCSSYIKQCIKKHGFLLGGIMGFDRIVRCGRDEVKLSPPIWIKDKKYCYDPVENNDFWWSKK